MSSSPEVVNAKKAFEKLAKDLAAINPRYKFEDTNYSDVGGKIRRYDETISNMYVEISVNFPHSGWNRVYTKPNLFFDTNSYKVQFHRNLKLYQVAIEDKVHTKVEEMFEDLRERDRHEKERKENGKIALKEVMLHHADLISKQNYDTKVDGLRVETVLKNHNNIDDEMELGIRYNHEHKLYSIIGSTGLTLEQIEAIKKIVFKNV